MFTLVFSLFTFRLFDGDLHAVGWGEGLQAFVTPYQSRGWEYGLQRMM